jgi:hypothetical protein
MTWNYRIVKTETPDGYSYGIYEVYYDESRKPIARTETPVDLGDYETVDDLRFEIHMIFEDAHDISKSILTDDDFGGTNA